MSHRILVTGGQASGKSAYAEGLLVAAPTVTYLAPGVAPADDEEWQRRIAVHQSRRPAGWTTVEPADLAAALRSTDSPVLVDSLGSWVVRFADRVGWKIDGPAFAAALDDLVDAWRSLDGPAVAVTDEVGLGLVSEHHSGRLFTDLLGRTNQAMAAASDEVVLVVAGRALRL